MKCETREAASVQHCLTLTVTTPISLLQDAVCQFVPACYALHKQRHADVCFTVPVVRGETCWYDTGQCEGGAV